MPRRAEQKEDVEAISTEMVYSEWPSIKCEVNGEQLKHAEGEDVALALCPSRRIRGSCNELNEDDLLGVALDQG